MVSWPCAVPVPESETLKVEFDPLDATVMSPVALAADCGVNTALKVTLAPGLRTSGKTRPAHAESRPGCGGLQDRHVRSARVRKRVH